jgi:hypothetical protein
VSELPPTKLIKDVLDGLLGKDVTMNPGDPLTSADAAGGMLAIYVDDANTMRAVGAWDLPGAVRVGAAIGLIPPPAANEAVDELFVPQQVQENLTEVCNVLASVFQIPGNPHLRLYSCHCPVAAAPADALSLMFRAGMRLDLDVEVPNYGAGRFALSMTP